MAYFCVDCEASGPLPPSYNLLSLGAVVVRREDAGHALGASYYVELQPVYDGFDPGALAVCGLDPDTLRRDGVPPDRAMHAFADWVADQNAGEREGPVFVGHNAVFDWAYVHHYFLRAGMENPFGYKGIDSKSLAMGKLGISWNATNKENLRRLLDLPRQEAGKVHRADYDAWYQALILQRLLDRPPGP